MAKKKQKILLVIDVQNDFITGALRNEEAIKKLPNIVKLLNTKEYDETYVTMDTHDEDYLNTLEGKKLPIKHCIKGTWGWQMPGEVRATDAIQRAEVFEKPTFGSEWMVSHLAATHVGDENTEPEYEFTIVGFCTDICVVSNALLLRAYFPNSTIKVVEDCMAGTSREAHDAAILVMGSCQVDVVPNR